MMTGTQLQVLNRPLSHQFQCLAYQNLAVIQKEENVVTILKFSAAAAEMAMKRMMMQIVI